MSKTSQRRLQELIIYAILIVVGLGTAAWYGPSLLLEAQATQDWPAITGRIEGARVVTQTRRRGSTRTKDYTVEVTYTYTLDKKSYHSTRYSVAGNPGGDTQEQTELLARGFRIGDEVKVYVDPNDPTQAVLERGGTNKAWLTIGFGALLFLVGLGLGIKRLLSRSPRS